jgi:hypothetical protein
VGAEENERVGGTGNVALAPSLRRAFAVGVFEILILCRREKQVAIARLVYIILLVLEGVDGEVLSEGNRLGFAEGGECRCGDEVSVRGPRKTTEYSQVTAAIVRGECEEGKDEVPRTWEGLITEGLNATARKQNPFSQYIILVWAAAPRQPILPQISP